MAVRVVSLGVPDRDNAWVRKETVHVSDELFVPASVSILCRRECAFSVRSPRLGWIAYLHPELHIAPSAHASIGINAETHEMSLVRGRELQDVRPAPRGLFYLRERRVPGEEDQVLNTSF